MHIKVWRGNKYYCTISGGRGTVTVGGGKKQRAMDVTFAQFGC
jgi:hypothetical protein